MARVAATRRIAATLVAVLAALAASLTTPGGPAAASASTGWTLRDPFSREVVRRGDVDADPWHIEHVYEVQHRLKRLGLFTATPNGRFGRSTEAAVRTFQRQIGLTPTGVVGYRTWQLLIKRTVRGRSAVPRACKGSGWHACYDRRWHQVNLYRDGTLLNSWLVRGGSASTPTRTGTFRVYYRDVDHVSSTFDGAPMPYSQFFSGGQAVHGSRLMVDPFVGHSHGCVNFWTEDAQQLWRLTSTKRLWVHVYGRWS
jgi:hypothetical protein